MLPYPLPQGIRIVGRTRETMTLQVTLPTAVVAMLSEVMEYAARMIANERPGAILTAMCQECLSSWGPAIAEQERQTEGIDDV